MRPNPAAWTKPAVMLKGCCANIPVSFESGENLNEEGEKKKDELTEPCWHIVERCRGVKKTLSSCKGQSEEMETCQQTSAGRVNMLTLSPAQIVCSILISFFFFFFFCTSQLNEVTSPKEKSTMKHIKYAYKKLWWASGNNLIVGAWLALLLMLQR